MLINALLNEINLSLYHCCHDLLNHARQGLHSIHQAHRMTILFLDQLGILYRYV